MRASITSAAIAFVAGVTAVPTFPLSDYVQQASGFNNPSVHLSAGGKAICVQGTVPVTASTTQNVKLNLPIPANQTVVTEITVQMNAAGSTFASTVNGGAATVSGTYNINAELCFPISGGINASTVQFLTHGVGFDKSYWDVAAGYSYVDAAASKGYTTFLYDRLGTGLSDRPDAHQVVQAPFELAIAHSLIQMLRTGKFASTKFNKVVGVGHSFGSAITIGLTAQFPKDLDAAVITGFTLNLNGVPTFTTSLDLSIASQNCPLRFYGLSNGYIVANNIIGNQFSFFKAQGFPYSNLQIADTTKQTTTFGELITLGNVIAPATAFTGPVDVVNGDADWPFCQGNCNFPSDQSQTVKNLYPAASSFQTYQAQLCGHGLNLHYTAGAAYSQIQAFVKSNGL